MSYHIPITATLSDEQRAICNAAIQNNRKPRKWRLSEYAMTKATAISAIHSLTTRGTAELFDVECLTGELARAFRSGHTVAADVFWHLRNAIYANPEASRAIAKAEACERAEAKAARLQRRAEKLLAVSRRLMKA